MNWSYLVVTESVIERSVDILSPEAEWLRTDVYHWLIKNIGPKNCFIRNEPRPHNATWQLERARKFDGTLEFRIWFREDLDSDLKVMFKFRF